MFFCKMKIVRAGWGWGGGGVARIGARSFIGGGGVQDNVTK
jgi:hypothetical protein